MWSHYADKHRGICLGFNINDDFLKKVNYIEKRAMITVGAEMSAAHVLEELEEFVLSTKYDHWSYEEEFRYFVSLKEAYEDVERKLHFFPFGDTLTLAEVILRTILRHAAR